MVVIPTFANGGTLTAPIAGTVTSGYLPTQLLPAQNMNYFMNAFCQISQELGYVLTTNAVTPASGTLTQVYTAINNQIATKVASLTTNVVTTADIYTTGFTDYSASSTIVGWSSFTLKKIFYKKVGRTVFVWYVLSGTSNSTSASFTVPVATSADFNVNSSTGPVADNGASQANGYSSISTSTPTQVDLIRSAGTAWTASGTKTVTGQFMYETA